MNTFSSDDVRKEFHGIYNTIPKADIRVTGTHLGNDENELFMSMGQKLVNESDYIIAVWNEKEGKGKGGTADVVAYAQSQKKTILLINPEDEHPFINYVDGIHYIPGEAKSLSNVTDTNYIDDFILRKQNEYNDRAVHYNKRYRRIWTNGALLGILEIFAFAIGLVFHWPLDVHFLIGSIEFFSLVAILLLIIFGKSEELHHDYVHNRIVSERLRIKRFFSELGFLIFKAKVSPIYMSIQEKPEYSILDETISLINLCAYSYWPFEQKKQHLEKELIMDQYKYHERKKEKFEKRNHQYKVVRKYLFLSVVVAYFLGYMLVANEFFLHHGIQVSEHELILAEVPYLSEMIKFIFLFVPSVIATCEALKYLYEWEKIIAQSASMATYFHEKEKELKTITTDTELEIFLNDINRDMLIENLDWEKYMKDKSEVPT